MAAFGDRPAREVTTREVSGFLRSLDREGLTPRNVNKHRQVLAAMFACGCGEDTFALAANPVSGTDKRREDPPPALDYYQVEEVEEVEALARCCERGEHRVARRMVEWGAARIGAAVPWAASPVPMTVHGVRAAAGSADRYLSAKLCPEELKRLDDAFAPPTVEPVPSS